MSYIWKIYLAKDTKQGKRLVVMLDKRHYDMLSLQRVIYTMCQSVSAVYCVVCKRVYVLSIIGTSDHHNTVVFVGGCVPL